MVTWNKKRQPHGEKGFKIKQGCGGESSGLLTAGSGTSSRSSARAIEFGFFYFFPRSCCLHMATDPRAPTICKDTRFYDLLSARFMERGSDQQFFIFSSQEQTGREARALAVSRADLQDPTQEAPMWDPAWRCCAPLNKGTSCLERQQ